MEVCVFNVCVCVGLCSDLFYPSVSLLAGGAEGRDPASGGDGQRWPHPRWEGNWQLVCAQMCVYVCVCVRVLI